MEKIFLAYATKRRVDARVLRFLLDGERIQPSQTPESLGMEDQDEILCVLRQRGGGIIDTQVGVGVRC